MHDTARLPVVNFAAGGIATPADAALMMQLGAEGVFVGSGIYKSSDPEARAKAIVAATTHYNDPDVIAKASEGSRRAHAWHGRTDHEAGGDPGRKRLVKWPRRLESWPCRGTLPST